MLKCLLLCCGLLLSGAGWAQAVDPLPFADRAEEVRFQQLTHELRCVQCQNNSLADSDGMIARDVRHEVFRLMQAGNSDQQIKQHLVERYGDFVLYRPPVKPKTWLLWFAPLILLFIGLLVLVRAVKHSQNKQNRIDDDWDLETPASAPEKYQKEQA